MKKTRLHQQPMSHRGVGGAQNHLPQHQQELDGGVLGLKPPKLNRPAWVGQQLHLPPLLGGVGAVAKRLNGNLAKLDKPCEQRSETTKQEAQPTSQNLNKPNFPKIKPAPNVTTNKNQNLLQNNTSSVMSHIRRFNQLTKPEENLDAPTQTSTKPTNHDAQKNMEPTNKDAKHKQEPQQNKKEPIKYIRMEPKPRKPDAPNHLSTKTTTKNDKQRTTDEQEQPI